LKCGQGMVTFQVWLKSDVVRRDYGKREVDEIFMPPLNARRCGIYSREPSPNASLVFVQVIGHLLLGVEELRATKIGELVEGIVAGPEFLSNRYISPDFMHTNAMGLAPACPRKSS